MVSSPPAPTNSPTPVNSIISVDKPLIQTPTKQSLVQLEWTMEQPDQTIQLHFGDVSAELLVGQDHPNGTKIIVSIPENQIGWQIVSPSKSVSNSFSESGELRKGYKIQAAEHDFDNDGKNELVIVAGNQLFDATIWVFSFHKVDNYQKINPMVVELLTDGQQYIAIEGNKMIVPFGSQGLFNSYYYFNQMFMQTVNVMQEIKP